MQHEAALASAMEDAAATAVVPLPTEATATTMGEDIAVQPALAAVSAANPSPAVLGAEGEAVIPGATAPVDVAYEEPAGVTSQPPTSGGDRENEPIYCVCKRVSFGEMIGCDGDECPTEWVRRRLPPRTPLERPPDLGAVPSGVCRPQRGPERALVLPGLHGATTAEEAARGLMSRSFCTGDQTSLVHFTSHRYIHLASICDS
jgi:hypothetical protein